MVLPEDGLTLHHYGYAQNLAHALLLAVDRPDAAAGQIYNAADQTVLTLRQVVETVAAALDAELEIVSMPWSLAKPARPLIGQPLPTHRVLDISKLENQLGYRDAVEPSAALALTARWLRDNPPKPGGAEESVLTDAFDYAAEDELIAAWQRLLAAMPDVKFDPEPGLTLAYSGPDGRARTQASFE